jgi:hypothetical protein
MPRESLQRLLEARNRQTSQNWSSFAEHRARVRAVIELHCPAAARSLCVLGAGNTHDLDLPWLAARFDEILLVDLDAGATEAGVALQLGGPLPSIKTVRLDVTGVYALLDAIPAPSPDDLAALRQSIEQSTVFQQIGATFDCVLSTCLLSQLVDAVKTALGEHHPEFLSTVQVVRAQHLRLATELAASKGFVAIISDFVSSLTCPELSQVQEAALPAYATDQIQRRNFFTGLNPMILRQALEEQLALSGRGSPVQLLPPWRWDLGPRQYLVTAVLARLP